MKLTSCNQRKERMRGGLKALADHMNHVTRFVTLPSVLLHVLLQVHVQ